MTFYFFVKVWPALCNKYLLVPTPVRNWRCVFSSNTWTLFYLSRLPEWTQDKVLQWPGLGAADARATARDLGLSSAPLVCTTCAPPHSATSQDLNTSNKTLVHLLVFICFFPLADRHSWI